MAERVTVVGEGLVGSVLALALAKRGFDVEVYERRPDPRKGRAARGRSINLAISARGLHALREIGLEQAVLERCVPMLGRMVHPVSGAPSLQPYGKDASEHINSVSRAWLNELLIEHAARSKRVRIRFDSLILGMDFRRGRLRVKDERSGRIGERAAKVVLAADGASSAIRREMSQLPRFDLSQEHLAHGYKELTLPAGPGGAFRLAKNALHIWPRGSYMLIALPNFDGSFTCTLFLPFEGPLSFASLSTPGKVRAFFRSQFPDAAALLPDLAEQFLGNPTGAMVTVRCRPWSVGATALLLGDAAHAIVPFYGQGMNCGFEDCSVLGRCLDRSPRRAGPPIAPARAGTAGPPPRQPVDWKAVFERFTALRKPNADAIGEMAVENFVEMRDKVADPRFLLQKKVEKVLEARFPDRYVPRYSLVTFSRVPYAVAQRAGAAQARILEELCAGVDSPDRVDLRRAERLIERELTPILSEAS